MEKTSEAFAQDTLVFGGQEPGAYPAKQDEKEQSVRLEEIPEQVYFVPWWPRGKQKKCFKKK